MGDVAERLFEHEHGVAAVRRGAAFVVRVDHRIGPCFASASRHLVVRRPVSVPVATDRRVGGGAERFVKMCSGRSHRLVSSGMM
jgi:hypothetical protein